MSSLEDYLKKRICPKGKHTFSYEDGILKFGDVEIIVKRVEADAYFYDILLKYFSFDTIRSLAQQVGIPHGKSWAEKASKLTSVEIGGKKVNLAKLFKEDKRLFWEYINFIDSTIGGWGCIFLEEFDEVIGSVGWVRSKAIRLAMRNFLTEYRWVCEGEGKGIGTTSWSMITE